MCASGDLSVVIGKVFGNGEDLGVFFKRGRMH
jgi:hypothetical protein